MTRRWWVGGILAVAVGVLVVGWLQSVQEQQRLARELTQIKGALVHLKDENASLHAQLTQVRADMAQVQAQRDEVTAKLNEAATQLAAADSARQQAEASLQTLREQEQMLRTEKTLLEGRIAVLQREKANLENPLNDKMPVRGPSTSSGKSSASVIPPTAGPSSSVTTGNKGYVIRDGKRSETASPQRVQVLPDPRANQTPDAPTTPPHR